jgi:hypothetical protein
VRCSLQSLQGERESRIGERKLGWFWDNLKIIFKRPIFYFFLKDKQFMEENEECFEII